MVPLKSTLRSPPICRRAVELGRRPCSRTAAAAGGGGGPICAHISSSSSRRGRRRRRRRRKVHQQPPLLMLLLVCSGGSLCCPCTALKYGEIWTQSELQFCGWRIRTPALVMTKTSIHVFGRCCGPNLCSSKSHVCIGQPPKQHCKNGSDPQLAARITSEQVDDDNSLARIVMKTSRDSGRSWQRFQVISPKGGRGEFLRGFTMGHGLFDHRTERLLLQYHHFPTNTTRPAAHVSTYQMFSTDDGASFSHPRDISAQVRGCSASEDNMMYLSAGNKIQTRNGRLLWPAHSFGGHACVWYSDDGE
eukprot:COSAG01_NODE_11753_length_1866_cov_1.496321_2_plen_304_part_00